MSNTHLSSAPGTNANLDSGIVQIRDNGTLAEVNGSFQAMLAHLFSLRRHYSAPGGSTGVIMSDVKVQFCKLTDEGKLLFYSSFVLQVVETLRSHGFKVEVLDWEPKLEKLKRDKAWLQKQSKETRRFVRKMDSNRRGLIEARSMVEAMKLVAVASRAFPEARLAIVTGSRSQARELRRQLKRFVAEQVTVLTGGSHRSDCRIRIFTMDSYHVERDMIVFFAQADQAATRRGGDVCELCQDRHFPRYFGFVHGQTRYSAPARMEMASRLGQVIFSTNKQKVRRANVRVLVAAPPLITIPAGLSSLERKRAIWSNERRNGAIAEVASAAASNRPQRLWAHGLLLDDQAKLPRLPGHKPRVAVLVESVEHGRELLKYLPGWWLLTDQDQTSRTGLSAMHPVILTLTHAASSKELAVDVMVLADAGSSSMHLRGFPPRVDEREKQEVLVIEFNDDFDALAATALRRRLETYEERGWRVTRRRDLTNAGDNQ